MRVSAGDTLYVTEAPDGGFRLTPYNPSFAAQMELAEEIMRWTEAELIQVNTDGLTVRIPRDQLAELEKTRKHWETATGLQLEEAFYKRMFIRDVNNYIAQYEDGNVKRKGAYEYEMEWHQNAGALVVAKVAEKVLTDDAPIRETVEQWPEIRGSRPLPVREAQTLAMELLMQRALERGLEGAILGSPVYRRYTEQRRRDGLG